MKRRGFTLMETILAAAILSIVLMVLFNLFPSSMVATRRAEHHLAATTLAESVLQEERAQPFGSLATQVGAADTGGPDGHAPYQFPWTSSPAPAPGDDGVQMVARFRVRAVSGADAKKLIALQVSVRWCEKASDRASDELTAAFANRDDAKYQEIVQELQLDDLAP